MQDYTFSAKYAKYLKNEKRREDWTEAVCDRVKQMHLDFYSGKGIDEEIEWAFDQYRKKLVLGSQRALQFGGEAVLKKNERIYNCSYTYIDRPRVFQEVMYLLLCGCGVGFSVQKCHISQLPPMVHEFSGSKRFVIPDTIEGWANAIGVLVCSYLDADTEWGDYKGKHVTFDYTKIREKGAPLSYGGKAPGPEPLKKAIANIKKVLELAFSNSEFSDRHLSPIQCYDILMHAADAVISGGVRRSATIALFSKDDEEMLKAKTGNWFYENPQRGRSNNSVLLVRDQTTKEEFEAIIQSTKEFGEPGFVFANSEREGFNPCAEISFVPFDEITGDTGVQFCVSGDTKLITKSGIANIENVIDKEIEVWNGNIWSKVKPFITNTNQDLYRVHLSDGSFLDCTEKHEWLVKDRFMKDYKVVQTKDLMSFSKYAISTPRANIKYENSGNHEEYAYEYGFILGDGTVRKPTHAPFANLFKDDMKLNLRGSIGESVNSKYYKCEYKYISFNDVDSNKAFDIKHEKGLPEFVFSWDHDSIIEFIAGWVDADGSKANKGCRLYGREDKIREAQLLLTKVGIDSSINLMQKAGVKTNLGVRKNDVWYLQIPNASKITSRRLDLSNGKNSKFKGKNQVVKGVEKLEGKHTTYCLTEPNNHTCVFNNVLTKQCNLTEINGKKIKDRETFEIACRASAIIGTLQAGYTNFPYLTEATKNITEKEALLGCSITGIMENPEILLDPQIQRDMAKLIKKTNKEIAAKIGINPAARCTCVKPAGTTSCILGSSSGIHPHHAKRYIRRIQANKLEDVYQFFMDHNPFACEESVWSTNENDDVISFCIEVPAGAKTKNQMGAIDLLEAVKTTQQNWVEYGTNAKLSIDENLRHNVSNTINVKPEEWDEVANYIYKNRKYFAGISLLSITGDKDYPQAPFTAIYLPSEMQHHYGDGVMFVSGLIEQALQLFDDNLWDACDCLLGLKKAKGTAKRNWFTRCQRFSTKYNGGDIKKLSYCMKDVYNYKTWLDLKRNYVDVNYVNLREEEDNTKIQETISCAGGSCEII